MIDDTSSLAFLLSEDGVDFQQVAMSDLDVLDASSCIIGVVHPKVAKFVDVAAPFHVQANRLADAITLLVEDVAPPTVDRSTGVEVLSFLVSGTVASTLKTFDGDIKTWCYRLLKFVLDHERLICELRIVHKMPGPSFEGVEATCDVILPHRGSEAHLRLSTDSLRQQTHSCNVFVAIDQDEVGAPFLADIADQNRIKAYKLSPCPVGPYVARHVFSTTSQAEFIAFQDSDDVSLPGRLATLTAAAWHTDVGVVGSHELQVDEVQKKVHAVRYPLDVSASLEHGGANHGILLPTALVRKSVVDSIGGFSTFRTFSLDVAFWLSASLLTRIINVDEFLYIRRRHATSLTMRADIGTSSRLRQEIVARRCDDYASIRNGSLRLEESSLAIRHRSGFVTFSNVRTGEVITARFESPTGKRTSAAQH